MVPASEATAVIPRRVDGTAADGSVWTLSLRVRGVLDRIARSISSIARRANSVNFRRWLTSKDSLGTVSTTQTVPIACPLGVII